MKTCSKCGEIKPKAEFYNKRGKKAGFSYCKPCSYQGKEPKREVRSTKEGHARSILSKRKYYAKKDNVPFDLDWDKWSSELPDTCPILGIKLEWGGFGKRFASDNSPSLDKIIPELGYIEGNVCWMSHKANTMKSNASATEIELLLNWMKTHNA